VLPVSLVAAVFARAPERSFSVLELKAEALGLSRELAARGARAYVPRGDEDYAIGVGLRMLTLRRLVQETSAGARVYRVRAEELPLLRYYAGSVAPLLEPA
jgi:hypothetical protein